MSSLHPAAATAAPRRDRAAWLSRINWLWLVLAGFLLFYWYGMQTLERVDGTAVIVDVFLPDLPSEQASAVTLPGWLTFIVEMFHPRVLRHFIPLLAGWWLAVEAAVTLVQVLYECPDRATARDFLRRLRGRRLQFELPYTITPKTIDALREESILLRVGGPVQIRVPNGYAAVTEINSRFHQVYPPGQYTLQRFEYLHSAIDLHKQDRTGRNISLLTKEGIPITADIRIIFRVSAGGQEPSRERPFPFDPDAVSRLAYSASVLPNNQVSSWDDGPLGKVRGELAKVVAGYRLDELIAPDKASSEPHLVIRRHVEREARAALLRDGIDLLGLYISRLSPPEDVYRQYLDYWLARAERQSRVARANGAAGALQELEVAQAEAQITLLRAIMEGVRRAQRETGSGLSGYLLALRLVEALEKMIRQSQQRGAADKKTVDQVLPQLTDLQEQLLRLDPDRHLTGNSLTETPSTKPEKSDVS